MMKFIQKYSKGNNVLYFDNEITSLILYDKFSEFNIDVNNYLFREMNSNI